MANFQLVFWAGFTMFLPAVVAAAVVEQHALANGPETIALIASLLAADFALCAWNRHRAAAATLSFEDEPPEVLTSLNLRFTPPVTAGSSR